MNIFNPNNFLYYFSTNSLWNGNEDKYSNYILTENVCHEYPSRRGKSKLKRGEFSYVQHTFRKRDQRYLWRCDKARNYDCPAKMYTVFRNLTHYFMSYMHDHTCLNLNNSKSGFMPQNIFPFTHDMDTSLHDLSIDTKPQFNHDESFISNENDNECLEDNIDDVIEIDDE